MERVGAGLLWDVFKHLRAWLANLRRAGEARKRESVRALREVVKAARETAVYMRRLQDTGTRDHAVEARLAVLWTDLGFALEDLGIEKLAKRCRVLGKQWAEPAFYDEEFLKKADVSLERMEGLARGILGEIRR